jgi:hypothetical protein
MNTNKTTELSSDISTNELVIKSISGGIITDNRIKLYPIYNYIVLKKMHYVNDVKFENYYKKGDTKTIRMNSLKKSDFSGINIIDLSNIEIVEPGLYEINANVVLEYLNLHPGDVEVDSYTFKFVKEVANGLDSDILVDTKSTILAFDQSFNYSNSSLCCMFKVENIPNDMNSKYKFQIKSDRGESDINNLLIKEFHSIIKRINI